MNAFAWRGSAAAVLLVLLAGAAHAQEAAPGRPGWTADANGCRVWNPYPEPGETLTWSGPCVKGLAHGRGAVQWFSNGRRGSWLEGDYREGRLSGRVVVVSADGRRYEGEWSADARNGRGVQTWPNGDRYDGAWTADRPNGQGTVTWANGKSLGGTWRAGCLRDGANVYALGRDERECRQDGS